MKRIILAILVASVFSTPATASNNPFDFDTKLQGLFLIEPSTTRKPSVALQQKESPDPEPQPKPTKPPKPKPIVYTVVEGDNLTKIGTEHNVKWQRLWAKNTQLDHPDTLQIGDKITIPLKEEKLKRKIPASASLPVATPGVTQQPKTVPSPSASYDASNTYDYGYCTWYVKNKRGASLPNLLGNANMWYANAQAMGMATGSSPAVGAVGTTTQGALGHVVYVERVNGDGTIYISEMNAPTWGAVTHRNADASEFLYIY